MGVHVVWFKRDLRVHDHAVLCEAARQGRVLRLYFIEPSLWAQPDASAHSGIVGRRRPLVAPEPPAWRAPKRPGRV